MPYSFSKHSSGKETGNGTSIEDKSYEVEISSTKNLLSGIPLDVNNGKVLISNQEHHCLIVGSSGRGKTRRVLFPSTVLSARAGHSLIVIDPKGELYRHTSNEVRRCGHQTIVINLRNPSQGNRWSPMALVQNYWDKGNRSRAMTLLKSIARIITAKYASERDSYWRMAAIDCFLGFSLLILEKGKTLTFSAVHSLANELFSDKNNRIIFRESLDTCSDSFRHLCTLLDLDSDITLGCVISEFNSAIAPFVDQPDIRDLLLSTDFDLIDIVRRPTAVFVILPDESDALNPIASLLIEISYEELIHYADSIEENTLPLKIDYIIDEFGNLFGSNWTGKLTAARSRGIKFIIAIQNYSQLSSRYGIDGAETIMSNCRTVLFIGGRDFSMMTLLSSLGGNETDMYGTVKPLITISKLSGIEVGCVAVLDDSGRTWFGRLPDWTVWRIKDKAELIKTERSFIPQVTPSIADFINNESEIKESEWTQ